MATYRAIHVKMWGDAKFLRLDPPPPNARYLWIYLLTGPHNTKIPGLFHAGELALSEALGWPLEGFREAFAKAFREGLIEADWRARLVWIPNAIRHNPPANPNVVRSWKRHFDDLPECDLKIIAFQSLKAFTEAYGKGFAKAFAEAFREVSGIYTNTNTKTMDIGAAPRHPGDLPFEPPPVLPKDVKEKRQGFVKPTAEDIVAYATEINYVLDGQRFCDYYEARGWKISGHSMKDWRATVRNWKRRDEENGDKGGHDWRITDKN